MALTSGNGEIVESRYDYRYAMVQGHVGCMADQVEGGFGPVSDSSARRSVVRPAAGAELGLSANRALRGNSPGRDAKPPQLRMLLVVVSPH